MGVWSVCSANRFVLEAALQQAREDNTFLLVESTSNQVNQYGGYTGMTPADFVRFVQQVATEQGFPFERIMLGGDHLGPHVWQEELADQAMEKAAEQVRQYVEAGFQKIHLDASMYLGDDAGDRKQPLDARRVAERTARLAQVAEEAARTTPSRTTLLLYVIGSEVPVPGGAQEGALRVEVTEVAAVEETIALTREAFFNAGLQDAWERVIAVVVQPGVEFSDQEIVDYQRAGARALKEFIESVPNLVYEAHSTDYQTPTALRELVEDHFAILKVGPWLTFAFREAVFALAFIEEELARLHRGIQPSGIRTVLEGVMRENPRYWEKHYGGSEAEVAFARQYSLSDRARYYWPNPRVQQALQRLLANLSAVPIPLSLISQFFPEQFVRIREGKQSSGPKDLIWARIREVTRIYARATIPESKEVGNFK